MPDQDPYARVIESATGTQEKAPDTRIWLEAGVKIRVSRPLLQAIVRAVTAGRDYVVVTSVQVVDGEARIVIDGES